jgi:hypothetical protein
LSQPISPLEKITQAMISNSVTDACEHRQETSLIIQADFCKTTPHARVPDGIEPQPPLTSTRESLDTLIQTSLILWKDAQTIRC